MSKSVHSLLNQYYLRIKTDSSICTCSSSLCQDVCVLFTYQFKMNSDISLLVQKESSPLCKIQIWIHSMSRGLYSSENRCSFRWTFRLKMLMLILISMIYSLAFVRLMIITPSMKIKQSIYTLNTVCILDKKWSNW